MHVTLHSKRRENCSHVNTCKDTRDNAAYDHVCKNPQREIRCDSHGALGKYDNSDNVQVTQLSELYNTPNHLSWGLGDTGAYRVAHLSLKVK